MDSSRRFSALRVAALFALVSLVTARGAQAEGTVSGGAAAAPSKTLRLPICGANEALSVRPDGSYVCKPLPTVPQTLAADCSLGGGADDGVAVCVPRGTGQTDAYYTTRKEALARWLDSGTTARLPEAPAAPARGLECGAFTKVSPELYKCEAAPGKAEAPALPALRCGAGQTITVTAQREVKCADLPAGRVALPCNDFASGQTSRDGLTIECAPRNRGAVDEALLARTLDYLYRMVEGLPPRDTARPVKSSLRTGRIPMCGEGQTLVWNGASLTCATQGAAGVTRTDAAVIKGIVERVIVKLQRKDPSLKDPFLPGAKLGDTAAVVFLDTAR